MVLEILVKEPTLYHFHIFFVHHILMILKKQKTILFTNLNDYLKVSIKQLLILRAKRVSLLHFILNQFKVPEGI